MVVVEPVENPDGQPMQGFFSVVTGENVKWSYAIVNMYNFPVNRDDIKYTDSQSSVRIDINIPSYTAKMAMGVFLKHNEPNDVEYPIKFNVSYRFSANLETLKMWHLDGTDSSEEHPHLSRGTPYYAPIVSGGEPAGNTAPESTKLAGGNQAAPASNTRDSGVVATTSDEASKPCELGNCMVQMLALGAAVALGTHFLGSKKNRKKLSTRIDKISRGIGKLRKKISLKRRSVSQSTSRF
jgi:hypothetical protein